MRIPRGTSARTPLRFNITPLIDIVFLLIIFFLVASHFVRNEAAEPVELPLALTAAGDEAAAAGRLTITVSTEGLYSVGGVRIDETTVRKRITDLAAASRESGRPPEVRIRADRRSRYRPVRVIIQACAENGISDIQFAVTDAGLTR